MCSKFRSSLGDSSMAWVPVWWASCILNGLTRKWEVLNSKPKYSSYHFITWNIEAAAVGPPRLTSLRNSATCIAPGLQSGTSCWRAHLFHRLKEEVSAPRRCTPNLDAPFMMLHCKLWSCKGSSKIFLSTPSSLRSRKSSNNKAKRASSLACFMASSRHCGSLSTHDAKTGAGPVKPVLITRLPLDDEAPSFACRVSTGLVAWDDCRSMTTCWTTFSWCSFACFAAKVKTSARLKASSAVCRPWAASNPATKFWPEPHTALKSMHVSTPESTNHRMNRSGLSQTKARRAGSSAWSALSGRSERELLSDFFNGDACSLWDLREGESGCWLGCELAGSITPAGDLDSLLLLRRRLRDLDLLRGVVGRSSLGIVDPNTNTEVTDLLRRVTGLAHSAVVTAGLLSHSGVATLAPAVRWISAHAASFGPRCVSLDTPIQSCHVKGTAGSDIFLAHCTC